MDFFEYLKEKKTISLNLKVTDWRDAIRKGGAYLVQAGCCTEEYIDAMIRVCEEKGPYFVLGPGLAMPHARPEQGALETGFALITLEKGIDFGDPENDPIDVLLFMAAKDSKSHTETAMGQVANFLDNMEWLIELRVAKQLEDVIALLEKAQIDIRYYKL